ncbi:MAG TPA: helix-turn-helix transcriptional regulator, partial [Stellaceae bacterium]|nr:helix-turn-helix transcriptional regulator [Stellaceae bacterium]
MASSGEEVAGRACPSRVRRGASTGVISRQWRRSPCDLGNLADDIGRASHRLCAKIACQNAVSAAIFCGMTGEELIQFRARMGWGRAELARRLEISPSRLADFERGCSRGKNSRPAQIPKVVELACRWLAEHEGGQRR